MEKRLQSPCFTRLPLAEVRPGGWLARQLRIQADGLSGHLDLFWPDIENSQWFGGTAEGWERAPYWLDGFIPLAWLTGDAALKARAAEHVEAVLSRQGPDGWLGPRPLGSQLAGLDVWGQLLMTKVLMEYHVACGDGRAVVGAGAGMRAIHDHIRRHGLHEWGRHRWFEGLVAAQWLHDLTGEAWLLEYARTLEARGFLWGPFVATCPDELTRRAAKWTQTGHVVNHAMIVKEPALRWRLSGEDGLRQSPREMVAMLDRYHGMATGMFTGDECLAGLNPSQGTELCAVVEYMYSLEVLAGVLGDAGFADRLERIAFNALPATFSPDMWSHQYDQQVNQIECSVRQERRKLWTTNEPDSNTFGLQPNYGCCTANLSQGWPKFAAHLWMRGGADELAAVAYAPSTVRTRLGGTMATVTLDTEYPFREELRLEVSPERPARFTLLLRIPAWAEGAELTVEGEQGVVFPTAGGFHRIQRQWRGTTHLKLRLPMRTRMQPRPRGAVGVERGPLLLALPIGEDWRRINADKPGRELPHGDWEVHPTTPWNYAMASAAGDFAAEELPVGDCPFSPGGAPMRLRAAGRRVEGWTAQDGSALPPPESPVAASGPVEELALIPYGCTSLRIAEFPVAGR